MKTKILNLRKKTLVLALLALSSGLKASDTEIYTQASNGTTTLMFMLDISGSMTEYDTKCNAGSYNTKLSNTAPSYHRYLCNGGDAHSTTTIIKEYFYKTIDEPSGKKNRLKTVYYECTNHTNTNSCNRKLDKKPKNINYYNSEPKNENGEVYFFKEDRETTTTYDLYSSRITRLKDAMFNLLDGTNGVQRLEDNLVIGLSAFSYAGNGESGYIVVPARSLSSHIDGKTQREILKENIANLKADGLTPTANAYADTAAYLLGTTTISSDQYNVERYFVSNSNKYNGWYKLCTNWSGSQCTQWEPEGITYYIENLNLSGLSKGRYSFNDFSLPGYYYTGVFPYSGFPLVKNTNYIANDSKYIKPTSLQASNSESQRCNGQGIYVLTDGYPNGSSVNISKSLMQKALGSNNASLLQCTGRQFGSDEATDSNTGWQCIADFSNLLVNGNTPNNLKIKTAVVGFGSEFANIPSYKPSLSDAENVKAINDANVESDVKNTAKWGIYGKGGWYSASSVNDITLSVTNVIDNLKTEIPPVTTGSATIPVDQLNTAVILPDAYFSEFQPTPDKNYKLWQGNIKKYNVVGSALEGMDHKKVVNDKGEIAQEVIDLWGGGVKNNLPIGLKSNNLPNRKLLVNNLTDNTLEQITAENMLHSNDTNKKGYLLAALGFNIDINHLPSTIDELKQIASLKQIGSTMHSSPILVTNAGKISSNGTTSDREDYILFGTTQGLLQVVDKETGVEKFAFLPNEMLQKQKKALLDVKNTTEDSPNRKRDLYYGIDGPWTTYSQYIYKNEKFTVNDDNGLQIAYGGLRMGGRSYYALNLKDINDPKLAFHIDPNTQTVYSQDTNINNKKYKELEFMAQSWSKPTIGKIKWEGTERLVMFVGGGYDAGGNDGDGYFNADGSRNSYGGFEENNYNQTNQKGAGIYMFDALTGQLLWWTGSNATAENTTAGVEAQLNTDMQYSIASQIKAIDTNGDGLIDHIYTGDLGGQVWRVDINNDTNLKNLALKTPVRILNLNDEQYSPRFYEMPAYTSYKNAQGVFAVVSIGSGNRSRPLAQENVDSGYINDAIYNIFDKDVLNPQIYQTETKENKQQYTQSANTYTTQNINLINTDTGKKLVEINNDKVTESGGWYYSFGSATGNKQIEKVMSLPIVINGDLYVTTFDSNAAGSSGTCGAGIKGESKLYRFETLPYVTSPKSASLGVGIIAPSVGAGSSAGTGKRIVNTATSLSENLSDREILGSYPSKNRLLRLSWYEKN